MKIFRAALGVFLSFLLVGQCSAAEESHVVLISLDGFPSRMFWDSKTPVPIIRRLAAEGVASQGMRVSNPAMTWPNHTTLVTGMRAARHSVLYNGLMLRSGPGKPVRTDPRRDKHELVAVPTIYDLFHKAGLRTASIDWPCTRNSGSLDDDFPDTPDNTVYMTPKFRTELVEQGILKDETEATFKQNTAPGRDGVWTQAACYLIRERKPHFLMLHLLNTDGIHHRYGAESWPSYTAIALADFYVGQVIDALEEAGIRKNTTVFVLSDHGFASAEKEIQPNVLLRDAGLLKVSGNGRITEARAHVVPKGGTGMIYLTDPATREDDRKKVIELLRGKEGVAEIIGPEKFAELGFPSVESNPGMADLILVADDGYSVSGSVSGSEWTKPVPPGDRPGHHGYLASNPKMDALFIATGRNIKSGVKIGAIDNIDVAPTIAHLLGHSLTNVDGKVLTEILSKP
jgi:Uncharacterized proteins of the AP superfamily